MEDSYKKLAQIVRIKDKQPIPGADRIELITMENNLWQVVAQKGLYDIGDLAVYFVIDTIVDFENPYLEFMKSRNGKVSAMKMKGVLSQGVLMPLIGLSHYCDINTLNPQPGDDVTELTKTTKRIRPEDLPHNLEAEGKFPSHIVSQTDELNLFSYEEVLKELQGKKVYITLKMDGSSGTFLHTEKGFRACSRRLIQKPDINNGWNRLAKKYNLEQITKENNCICQGELVGPKYNGNKLKLEKEDLFIFDVFFLENRRYLNPWEVLVFCNQYNLQSVPVLETIENFNWSAQELLDYTSKVKYSNGQDAEGTVLRSADMEYSPTLEKRLSVKVINPNYK